MQDVNAPIDVVFIAGAFRSGSTLVDRILGTTQGAFAVGELGGIWESLTKQGMAAFCSCGKFIQECDFWHEVLQSGFGALDSATIAHLYEMFNPPKLPFFPRLLLRYESTERASEYRDVVSRLYAAVAKVSGARRIIDSSKTSAYGALLLAAPGLRLSTLHLVRDSRAVAFSWSRALTSSVPAPMPILAPAYVAASWNREQVAAELLGFRSHRSIRVRYEDLAQRPAAVLPGTAAKLGLKPPVLSGGSSVALARDHTVHGNPMRFVDGEIAIREDDEWKTALPPGDARLVTMRTAPLLLRYGYSLRYRR